eukprot:6201527-Pleurochrysis_carterae.AAC.2
MGCTISALFSGSPTFVICGVHAIFNAFTWRAAANRRCYRRCFPICPGHARHLGVTTATRSHCTALAGHTTVLLHSLDVSSRARLSPGPTTLPLAARTLAPHRLETGLIMIKKRNWRIHLHTM